MLLRLSFVLLSICLLSVRGGGWNEELIKNSERTVCSGAPSCGTTLATFNGVSAYSNGANQCSGYSCGGYGTYGYQYQCVELAQRYFATFFNTAPIWYANAIDMCTSHPSNVFKTNEPHPGDLIVLNTDPPYGHVAVITSVNPGTSMTVIEQNADVSGRNTYSYSQGYCFLTANQTTTGGANCNGKPDGTYCGNNGVNGSPNVLYYCTRGVVTSQTTCPQVCESFPQGYNDKCSSANCQGQMNGYYCGDDAVSGSDPDALYLCNNGAVQSASHCMNGCISAAPGTADYCA